MLNKYNFSTAALIDGEAMGPISGLLISPGSTVETDGSQIVIVTAPEVQPTLFPEDDGISAAEEFTAFIMDRESALKLAKIMPKPKAGDSREMAVIDISTEVDGTSTLAINDDGRRAIIKSEKIPGPFPDVARVIPDIADARWEISFSSDVLVPVLKAFQAFSPSLTIRLFGTTRGIRIDAERDGQRMTAVVIPTRQVEEVDKA